MALKCFNGRLGNLFARVFKDVRKLEPAEPSEVMECIKALGETRSRVDKEPGVFVASVTCASAFRPAKRSISSSVA